LEGRELSDYQDKNDVLVAPIKQLLIRNEHGGAIWQVYTIESDLEATVLTRNASNNGFQSIEIVTVDIGDAHEDTFPGWRYSYGWKACMKAAEGKA
jgi:hypothetical protein